MTDGLVFACIHNVDHLEDGEPAIHELHAIDMED
jgi:hypothetical protein